VAKPVSFAVMTSWRPLLEGDLAARALEAVRAVADALPATPFWISPEAVGNSFESAWTASLASGAAGQAVFYSYYALDGADAVGPERADPGDLAVDLLDRATDAVAAAPMSDSLYSGFPGIAWTNEHLEGRLFEPGDEEANLDVDHALIDSLSQPRRRAEYDLINGYVGLGIYALEGLPRPTAVQCLERVIERLAGRAEHGPEGAAWFSPPESMPQYQAEMFPQGLYNMGPSHGIAGVAALLGAACAAGVATAAARPLLAETVRWLLARRQPEERGFCFPHFYHPEVPVQSSRLAWCYGDLGTAATLLVAARGAGEPAWERTAVEVALAAAARPVAAARVRDAGICHGGAGLAHLFNRMYQATGDERLAAAARSWFEWVLDFRQPGLGVAGFRSWASDPAGTSSWRDDPGFLEGATGVGLALLAALSTVEPEWDRVLLVSAREARDEG
jgi:class I lanthipeptide synthase